MRKHVIGGIALAALLAISSVVFLTPHSAESQVTGACPANQFVSVIGSSIPAQACSQPTVSNLSGILPATSGGTGVNNGANTITLGGALVTGGAFTQSGAFATTITSTATTNSTLPSGTHNLAPLDSPSFTTPTLGVATATSLNGNTFTTGTYTLTGTAGKTLTFTNNSTLSSVDGKTLTFNNNLTLAGTDGQTMTFPATSATIARTEAGQTFTGVQTFSSAITPTGGVSPAGGFTVSPRNISTCNVTPSSETVTGAFTAQTPVNTEVYIAEVTVPYNVTVTGVAVLNSSTLSGNLKVGLANSAGTVVATSASTANAGSAVYQLVPFTGTYAAVGPATYYVLTFYDNNTVRPNALTVGSCGVAKQTGQTYATGFTTITPPTTFTTALGPVANLY